MSFQLQVATWFAVHALAEQPTADFFGGSGKAPVSVWLETPSPVDDVMVETEAGGILFVNAKTSVSLSAQTNSELASVIEQFVRQWIVCSTGSSKQRWDHPLDPSIDRFVLAVSTTNTRALASALQPVLERIRHAKSIVPVEHIATTKDQKNAYDVVISHIRRLWLANSGTKATDDQIAALLSLVQLVQFDFEGASKTAALNILGTAVLQKRESSAIAWDAIYSVCNGLASLRSGASRSVFREELRRKGIALQHSPTFAKDIERIKRITDKTLTALQRYSHISVPTSVGEAEVEVIRTCSSSIAAAAVLQSFLVVGEPGAGKSGALYAAVTQLKNEGHPVTLLAVDEWNASSLEALGTEMRLENSLPDVLNAWVTEKSGILVIDALDASRGNASDRAFQDLIDAILKDVTGWTVVASIRKFDLRYGVRYQELFSGKPVAQDFVAQEFPKIRHLHIPRLSENELDQIWQRSPKMQAAYAAGTLAFRELLTSPFNLFLLATIVTQEDPSTTSASSQVELLGKYWLYRVDQPSDMHRINRVRLLKAMTEMMIERRELSIKETDLGAHDGLHLERLLKSGVLVSQGEIIPRVFFSHHMLFDYAVARLVMLEAEAIGIEKRLALSDDHALVLAPAAMIAFRMLWERDVTRNEFWNAALAVAASNASGPFSRMLSARVAAEVVTSPSDFNQIVENLSDSSSADYQSSLFLVSHIFGTLLANVVSKKPALGEEGDPWCRIVKNLSAVAIADLVWPFKAVIAQWVEKPENLTPDQKSDLGVAARKLLFHGVSNAGNNYDEGCISSGIRGVARTLETAPTESANALRLVLEPSHVKTYGHRELFWLAMEFPRLLKTGPEILGDLFRVTYGTPLPSSDEISHMGNSRILSLTSNKRQDFEMARHQLEDKIVPFLRAAPKIASEAIIGALDHLIPSEHSVKESTEIDAFAYMGFQAKIREDYSYIWWRPNDQYGRGGDKILDGLVKAICDLCDEKRDNDINSIVESIADKNIWACGWSALLQSGIGRPLELKRYILPLLQTPVILGGESTHYAAGRVIEKLHAHIDADDRRRIEEAILHVEEPSIQSKLLGCMQPNEMVDAAAKKARQKFEDTNSLRTNKPPYSLEVGGGPVDGGWWYREAGIDLNQEPNATINAAIISVENLVPPESRDKAFEYMRGHWPLALELYRLLNEHPHAPERLRLKGWDQLAEAVEKAAKVSISDHDLAAFSDIEEILFSALSDDLPPEPVHDAEREESFAKSASWGRPAPRIEAAGAIMLLARAKGRPSAALGEKIRQLAIDPAVEVRHAVLSRINTLFSADPELMRELLDRAFAEEENIGVLTYFLGAVYRTMSMDSAKISDQILVLDERLSEWASDETKEIYREIAGAIVSLWVSYGQEAASARIRAWLQDPITHRSQVQRVLNCLRDAMLVGDPEGAENKDDVVRKRAVEIFSEAVLAASNVFNHLAARPERSEAEQKGMESAFRVLDTAATEIYFGSGAYSRENTRDMSSESRPSDAKVRGRFLQEMGPVLDILAGIAYPSITHHVLQTLQGFISDDPEMVLRTILKTLQQGGQDGGYQFESLGADLFVRLVRRYLADHAAMIAEDPEFRIGIIKALDLFARVGWADARQLVYELPEMLR